MRGRGRMAVVPPLNGGGCEANGSSLVKIARLPWATATVSICTSLPAHHGAGALVDDHLGDLVGRHLQLAELAGPADHVHLALRGTNTCTVPASSGTALRGKRVLMARAMAQAVV